MIVELRGKNGFQANDQLVNKFESKLKKLDKYTMEELKAQVVVKFFDSVQYKVEVTLPVRKFTIRAEVTHKDLNVAIDQVVDKLDAQIRKNKHKLSRGLQDKEGVKNIFVDTPAEPPMVNSALRKKMFKLEIMSFDEAVTQMELLGHTFYVYKNEQEQVCIAYLRNDKEYGLIETV